MEMSKVWSLMGEYKQYDLSVKAFLIFNRNRLLSCKLIENLKYSSKTEKMPSVQLFEEPYWW